MADVWSNSDAYERFMGRWSKKLPVPFLQWLEPPPGLRWLDLGCGTGVLSEAIYQTCRPTSLICVDPSPGFMEKAKERVSEGASFMVGGASDIPVDSGSVDILVSGLALNFFPDQDAAFAEMKRVVKPGGTIAAYLWDIVNEGMQFLNVFWKAASEADPAVKELDERNRFPICDPATMREAFQKAGLTDIQSTEFSIETPFKDFADYWEPFLGGQGPAATYLASLEEDAKEKLKKVLQGQLGSGPINLTAKAIAVRGVLPG
jgi:ubiquinone/menaquinone biosynthesis C-methylase UbiE